LFRAGFLSAADLRSLSKLGFTGGVCNTALMRV
jgi:hypothetical protein